MSAICSNLRPIEDLSALSVVHLVTTEEAAAIFKNKPKLLRIWSAIDFRGLRHAPINEEGVVFLFGMVHYELGFIAEAVHACFATAKPRGASIGGTSDGSVLESNSSFAPEPSKHSGTTLPAGSHRMLGAQLFECPLEVVKLRKATDELDG